MQVIKKITKQEIKEIRNIARYYNILYNQFHDHVLECVEGQAYRMSLKLRKKQGQLADQRLYTAIPEHIWEGRGKLKLSPPIFTFRLHNCTLINGRVLINNIPIEFGDVLLKEGNYRNVNLKVQLFNNTLTVSILNKEDIIHTVGNKLKFIYSHYWDYDLDFGLFEHMVLNSHITDINQLNIE
jgi:hypothetical protein